MLDLAEGILIGCRGYASESAFEELVSAAQRNDVSMSAIAAALVDLASGATDVADTQPAARAVAQVEWGHLLASKVQP
ncbi:hypothetical protein BH09ACT7_BH09ACT7_07190 [soil metagenome]